MTSRTAPKQLFSWLFIAAGSIALYFLTLMPILNYWQSGQWQAVPATITHLELISNTSDGSTTYRVDANYQYEFNGQRYRSDQVSLSDGSDNIGDYWHQLHRKLRRQQSQEKVVALVNPDNPEEALLDRSLRPGVLLMGSAFGVIFIGIGLAVMRKPAAVGNDAHPGDIFSEQKGGYKLLLFIGLAACVLGSVVTLASFLSEPSWQPELFLILIFPGAGALMAWQGFAKRKRYLLLGTSPLTLNPNPASANGHVGGIITLASQLDAPLTLTLQCIHRYTTGSGDDKKTEERILWSDQSVSWPGDSPQQHCFVFRTEGRKATGAARRGSIYWRLRAEGKVKTGTSSQTEILKRSWQIPVNEASAHTSLSVPENHAYQVSHQFEDSASESFGVQQQGQELYFVSAAGRNMTANLGLMATGAVFFASGLFLLNKAMQEGGALWFMASSFTLVGLILVLAALWIMGRKLETWISPRGVRTQRSWFGKTIYRRSVQSALPEQLDKKKTSTMKSGSEHHEFYKLYISADGKNLSLAEGINSRASADALLSRMRQAITGHLDDELGL